MLPSLMEEKLIRADNALLADDATPWKPSLLYLDRSLSQRSPQVGSQPLNSALRHLENPSSLHPSDGPLRTIVCECFLRRWVEVGDSGDPIHITKLSAICCDQQSRRCAFSDSVSAKGQ